MSKFQKLILVAIFLLIAIYAFQVLNPKKTDYQFCIDKCSTTPTANQSVCETSNAYQIERDGLCYPKLSVCMIICKK